VKTLVYHDRRGPAVVFLPPKDGEVPPSAAAPDHGVASLNAPAYAQVAARGSKASWDDHCRNLVNAPPYAGRWTVEDVPDGSSTTQALRHVREAAAMRNFAPEESKSGT
jgi:hypothetical protein